MLKGENITGEEVEVIPEEIASRERVHMKPESKASGKEDENRPSLLSPELD